MAMTKVMATGCECRVASVQAELTATGAANATITAAASCTGAVALLAAAIAVLVTTVIPALIPATVSGFSIRGAEDQSNSGNNRRQRQ